MLTRSTNADYSSQTGFLRPSDMTESLSPTKRAPKQRHPPMRIADVRSPEASETHEAWIALMNRLKNAAQHGDDSLVKRQARSAFNRMQLVLEPIAEFAPSEGAEMLALIAERWTKLRRLRRVEEFDVDRFLAWFSFAEHTGKPDRGARICDCLRLIPPVEVEIDGRIGAESKQKRVYAARWKAADRGEPIVLKEFLGDAAKVIPREMQAYPLSMMHPNIIQTYRLENPLAKDKPFLAERRIHPRDDQWRSRGLVEAARLLSDLARALAFLADRQLVHNDLKPDNVGYNDGRYLLLDFGVARKAAKFAKEAHVSGTLKTRAPEVILGKSMPTTNSDVYALAAVVFNAVYGRFPLVDVERMGEADTDERTAYVSELRSQLAGGWRGHLELLDDCRHDGFRILLRAMLDPNPKDRPSAAEVLARSITDLESLVGRVAGPLFRPWEELDQFEIYLGGEDEMRLLPKDKVTDLEDRLAVLSQGLAAVDAAELADELLSDVRAALKDVTDAEIRDELLLLVDALGVQRAAASVGGHYEKVVARLGVRIQHSADEWGDHAPDDRTVLMMPLRPELESLFSEPVRTKVRSLIEILERRRALQPAC
jgi:serine/threonine protein kinase